ncbi:MAG: LLM class F420-dependent oxidoreductase [Acidimicrobiia bacterium]
MKFGIAYANAGPFSDAAGAAALATAAEEAGFESLWTVEHVVVPAGYESTYPYASSGKMAGGVDDFALPEPFVWLAYVAALTTRIRLGTGVLILPQRNPLVVAKAAATLDAMSGGRFMMGVGAGWLEEEFTALGVPFADRGARTDDYLRALRVLLSADLASYEGDFTSFTDVYLRPLPEQRPVPLIVGGHSVRAARRAGELGDGFFPGRGSTEQLAELWRRARDTAERSGRDPARIELTVGCAPDPDAVGARIDIGADRVVFGVERVDDVVALGESILPRFA